jgi:hypothetical protein
MSAPAKAGARLRVHRIWEVTRELSRQARAMGPPREALAK